MQDIGDICWQLGMFIGAIAVAIVAFTRDELRFARWCFWAFALLVGAGAIVSQMTSNHSIGTKMISAALVGAFVFAGLVGGLSWIEKKEQSQRQADNLQPTLKPLPSQLDAHLFSDPQSQEKKSYGVFWAAPKWGFGWFGETEAIASGKQQEKTISVYLTNSGPGNIRHVKIHWRLHSPPIANLIETSGLFKDRITRLTANSLQFQIANQNGTAAGGRYFQLDDENSIPVISDGATVRALLPEKVKEAVSLYALAVGKVILDRQMEENRKTRKAALPEIQLMPQITMDIDYDDVSGSPHHQRFSIEGASVVYSNVTPGDGTVFGPPEAGAVIYGLSLREL